MAKLSRYKKRESDQSGFDEKEIAMIKTRGMYIAPDEFDVPPPSDHSLGGEGEVNQGDMRNNSTSYDEPSDKLKKTYYITSNNGISYAEKWMYIAGSNASINVLSDPQITLGAHNNFLTLECVGSAIILENGSGLSLREHYQMESGDILNLICNRTDNLWHETSRSSQYASTGRL